MEGMETGEGSAEEWRREVLGTGLAPLYIPQHRAFAEGWSRTRASQEWQAAFTLLGLPSH